jgi:predicted DNA-binding transcriptional regulator YafY
MRADRLVAALLLLQRRGRVTATELARELEVSVATARRDFEALSAAGIPVYPQPGRGGGWSLVGGARTDLSGLSAAEAQALFLLVGPAAVSDEAKGALRKLVQALPQTFRADAEAAASATVIDPAGWGERDRGHPPLVDRLQAAVIRRRKVRLTYTSAARARSERLVDPWGLVAKDEIWYLIAGTDRGQRTFRVDRIIQAEQTDQPASRPDGFILASAWEPVVAELNNTAHAPGRPSSFRTGSHRSCATALVSTATPTANSTTAAHGCVSPRRPRWTLPGTWLGGAKWWRSSSRQRCAPNWPGSAPSSPTCTARPGATRPGATRPGRRPVAACR